ncbi:damage-control phosphatase ARMT1 family protein [Nitratifractor salsuginis]|uniref:Damage-control phosphatase ARMT1-like metal-binding domain-containing protein n=1 Tax=Nitratifractor salsuginis (strain DSM 16511 / JCM 12458 / E9I37-1) TaxID=749222 RepID=E6X3K4_NITSE|nr:ARMT1-like domain-containing protein [Nitratifractor salsuginis]ADV46281.1 protein of unknown function DUF89 [Nitratifractor salsuginis DSM 16511]
MWMIPDCLACLYNQMLRTSKAMHCDDECATRIMEAAAGKIAHLPMQQTPPEAAAILYPIAAAIAGTDDPYKTLKRDAVAKAGALIPGVVAMIESSRDPLDAALRAAVAGNVIDYATQVQFSLEEELARIFNAPFAVDDKALFLEKLNDSKSLLVIGDNVGEHLFDKVMLETIRRYYPDLKIYYMVRGKPIINDVTMEEAMEAGLQDVAILVDSGVDTPGFLPERASETAREIYQSADLILAKGMGNYECMESFADERVMFLLKIKCSVVAEKIGKEIGDLVAMMSRK